MRPTANPANLRNLAEQCNLEARQLDGAVQQLDADTRRIMASFHGSTAESFKRALSAQLEQVRQGMDALQSAGQGLEQGAAKVEAFIAAEEKREREAREKKEE